MMIDQPSGLIASGTEGERYSSDENRKTDFSSLKLEHV